MKRLTEYHHGVPVIKGKKFKEAAEKLAMLEDLEEEGRLYFYDEDDSDELVLWQGANAKPKLPVPEINYTLDEALDIIDKYIYPAKMRA